MAYIPLGMDLDHGAKIIENMQQLQRWFGAEVTDVIAVIFPGLKTSPLDPRGADVKEGFYLGMTPPYDELTWGTAAFSLLSSYRHELTSVEIRLVEAYLETERRRTGSGTDPSYGYRVPYSYGYGEGEDPLPSAPEIADWLEEYGDTVENPVHRLYRLAGERPLAPEDLDIFRGPPQPELEAR